MTQGYYEILGVPTDASPEVIKRAYFTCIRKHPPEKDPAGNQRIREAYEVLKDPSRRKEYDAQSLYGEELNQLWNLYYEHNENKNYKEEAKVLKRILVISEDNSNARVKLSRSLLFDGMYAESFKVAQNLVKRKPEDSFHWYNLGYIHEVYADNLKNEDTRKELNYNEARSLYAKAIKIDPGKSNLYIAIARCFAEERKWTNAFLWAEKAIDSYKNTASKWPDIEALFYPLELCLKSGKIEKIVKFAENIQNKIPDEPEIKSYASQRLGKYAVDLFTSKNFKAAFHFLNSALLFNPENEELKKFCQFLKSANNAMDEIEPIINDENIIWPIKGIVLSKIHLELGLKTENEMEAINKEALENLGKFAPESIIDSIEVIQSNYPGHWRIISETLLKIKEIAIDHMPRKKQSNPTPRNVEITVNEKKNLNDTEVNLSNLTGWGIFLGLGLYFSLKYSDGYICPGIFAFGLLINISLIKKAFDRISFKEIIEKMIGFIIFVVGLYYTYLYFISK